MNFLTEVLSSAEQADIENSKKNLPIIRSKIASCKEEINKYIDDVYLQFREWPKTNQQLLDTTTQLSNDIHNLQKQIEEVTVKEIASKTGEMNNLSVKLQQSNIALGIVIHLVQIHELFMTVKELQNDGLYIKAAFEIIRIEECLNSIPDDEITDGVQALKLNILVEKGNLIERICEIFETFVKVTVGKPGNVQINTIRIRKECKDFVDILTVLELFDKTTMPINKFSKFLWRNICKPIIENLTVVKSEVEDDYHVLNVIIKKTQFKSPYNEVFSKLIDVFTFLHANFNYQIDENLKTVSYIGEQIKLDLSEGVLKGCLGDTLPSGDDDCSTYKQVVADTKTFQCKLVALEILADNANPILDYTNNMESIFVNKKCQEYSAAAMAIMKKDLHNMVEVGVSHEAGTFLTGDEYPESSVSRSAVELLELTKVLFDEAVVDTDIAAARAICTAQSIFYQYGSIVHGYHEKLLQTIPQQVVLFRNNCMYLAHQLTQLNETYSGKFSATALPVPPIFKDQPHHLRTIGGDTFLGYVEDHIRSMEYTLDQYQFTSEQITDHLNIDTDKCIRQCIRQYELLRTVWQKILPNAVYNKTLGYLLNAFCKRLIETVTNAQDIPSKNSEHIVDMYKIVLTRGPKLFTDPHEVGLYVELWQKLQDIVFILNAPLAAIDDRWADGKGPLTLNFSPEEIRNLIKALFQNTDRRAAVLSKIH